MEWLSQGLTLALVVITATYAVLTRRIVKVNERIVESMRMQFEAATRPYVHVVAFVSPEDPRLYLRVINTGQSGAENLRLRVDKDVHQYGDTTRWNLALLKPFNEGIATFPPGAEMTYLLGASSGENMVLPAFQVSATYTSAGRQFDERFAIDPDTYLHSSGAPSPVAREIVRLRQALEKRQDVA